jgi:uncharacterized protein
MGFEQYDEPVDELPPKTRTFARMIVSLTEEAEAINWYEQRMALEKDKSPCHYAERAKGRVQTLLDGLGVAAACKTDMV